MAYLTVAHARQLKGTIAEEKRMFEEHRKVITDSKEFVKNVIRKEALLRDHTPREFQSDNEKNKAVSEYKDLGKYLAQYNKTGKPHEKRGPQTAKEETDFNIGVRREFKKMTDRDYMKKVARFKELGGQIDPSDPTLRNTTHIRG